MVETTVGRSVRKQLWRVDDEDTERSWAGVRYVRERSAQSCDQWICKIKEGERMALLLSGTLDALQMRSTNQFYRH